MTTLVAERVGRWVPPKGPVPVVNVNYSAAGPRERESISCIPNNEDHPGQEAIYWDDIQRWMILSWRADGKAADADLPPSNRAGAMSEEDAQEFLARQRQREQQRYRHGGYTSSGPSAWDVYHRAPPPPGAPPGTNYTAEQMRQREEILKQQQGSEYTRWKQEHTWRVKP